ncbi:MAG: T9SS type A sorting domain-containing protein [Bacteroidetes bacterium]|nr:MAG: T9SS type A sorting domain-containing protein [Bacteroidota bacterium]
MKKYFPFIFTLISCFTTILAQEENFFLIARNKGEKILTTGDTIRTFGFARKLSEQPGVPGPTLVVKEGDSVHIDLLNMSQGAPHTIHLHGLDVDQQNDGVPHLSFEIPHMEHGFYHFKAPHPGTYLYHCHVASTIHVQAGMYGLIIVKPSDGSNKTWDGGESFVNEHSYFLSEIDTVWHRDSVLLHPYDTSHVMNHIQIPHFDPQFFLINGLSDQQLLDSNVVFESSMGQQDFVRLANIGFCGVRVIFPQQLKARIVSSDGRPFETEESSDTIYVYPGERYGVLTKSSVEFSDQIRFEYLDLNTNQLKNTQVIPVSVQGQLGLPNFDQEEITAQLVPNPFYGNTDLHLSLREGRELTFKIYDLQGRLVEEHEERFFTVGQHEVALGKSLRESGIYTLQIISAGNVIQLEKLLRLE